MRRLILVLALSILASGCEELEDWVKPGPRPGGERVVYTCWDKTRITVRFPKDQAVLTTPQGQTLVLKPGPAADGFFYEGHGHQLRGVGDEVAWTPPDGQARSCRRA